MTNLFDKDEVVKKLQEKICTITFARVDGSERVMNATLMENYVKPMLTENAQHVKRNPLQVSVIDTDINEWRSFNIERLISIE
jgi:hypothetical protein